MNALLVAIDLVRQPVHSACSGPMAVEGARVVFTRTLVRAWLASCPQGGRGSSNSTVPSGGAEGSDECDRQGK